MGISMRKDISINTAVLPINHRGWAVWLEPKGHIFGRIYVTAIFTPLNPLSRDKAILKDLLSQADYMIYIKLAGMYIASLGLPQAQSRDFPAGYRLWPKSACLNEKTLRKILAKAKDYAETHLPAIGPIDINDYLAYMTAGGMAPEAISVIRLLHTDYPSGNVSD